MLKGIVIKHLKGNCDERGSFTEIMREDWKDLLGVDRQVQANFATTYPRTIRAWHRHVKSQTDYFVVLKGALKICAYDEETKELDEIISTDKDLQIVKIPGNYWHGYKTIGNKTASLVYFVTKLYQYQNPDEERKPWNDQSITPSTINGRNDDPRVNRPWDWNYPPHK